jgi:GT2 family glycosyltransferase
MDISIVIVSYKTPELVLGCIRSIFESGSSVKFEVIVVDNANDDGTIALIFDQFPDVRWIDSGYNAGFARANNIGISMAKGSYILALNPDTTIKYRFLDDFFSFYKAKNIDFQSKLGFLTCRIVSSLDQTLQVGSGKKFVGFKKEIAKNPIFIYLNRIINVTKNSYDPAVSHFTNHEVDFVSGACFIIEKSKIDASKLYFDEDFFLYYEDLELSYRSRKLGFRNYFCADLEIYHVNSASTSKITDKNYQINISKYLFYFKRFNRIHYLLMGNVIRFNFFFDRFLLKRKNETELLIALGMEEAVFKKYYFQIQKVYGKNILKKIDYLKYDQENKK